MFQVPMLQYILHLHQHYDEASPDKCAEKRPQHSREVGRVEMPIHRGGDGESKHADAKEDAAVEQDMNSRRTARRHYIQCCCKRIGNIECENGQNERPRYTLRTDSFRNSI